MGTRYLVTAVEDCAECGGTGYVEHLEWLALREQVDVASLSDEQIEAWFASRGCAHVPDEEVRCYECDGNGTSERQISLSKALAGSYRELELRVDELQERLEALEENRVAPGMTPADDAMEAAEAAFYDEHHAEWEGGQWRDEADRLRTMLASIASLEGVDLAEARRIARQALEVN